MRNLVLAKPSSPSNTEATNEAKSVKPSSTSAANEAKSVYLKEDLPSRLNYFASDRISPIIGLIEESYKVEQKESKRKECGGAHGYDNAFFSMRTIFIGHGPQFPRGKKVPSFENVQIYNLVTSILNIQGASNNGTASFPDSVMPRWSISIGPLHEVMNLHPRKSVRSPFENRVDTVLEYFDLPDREIPVFMTLYFEDPDHQGHQVGPDDPEITDAVSRIDRMIGRLIEGLEKRGVFEDVNIIMVGDHGMVGTCDKKLIFLEDLARWIEIPKDWVQSYSPLLAIRPPAGWSPLDVVTKMNKGLSSGKVDNGQYLKVYLNGGFA
ncbi:hypothetical protein Vadar_026817 [Vaccinium darrowii]|uniref:Uncharacterized protein n=1 Tax=Vaccinium darrowii TaxID=229202 RepID=A0ACB7YHJ0_9ERIC|nr:hypothetical protein Vadar_026817 [Vaccinium darrowii]